MTAIRCLKLAILMCCISIGSCSLTVDAGIDKDVRVVISSAKPVSSLTGQHERNTKHDSRELLGTPAKLIETTIEDDDIMDVNSKCGHHKNPSENQTLVSGCKYKFFATNPDMMAKSYLFGWVAIKKIVKEGFTCFFVNYECRNIIIEEKSKQNSHWSNDLCEWRVRKGSGDDYFYVPAFPYMKLSFDQNKDCNAYAGHEENYIGTCIPKWDRFGSRDIAENQLILGSENDHIPMGRLSWYNPSMNNSVNISCQLIIRNRNNGRVALLIANYAKYIDIIDNGTVNKYSPVIVSGSDTLEIIFTENYHKDTFDGMQNYMTLSYLFLPNAQKASSYVFPTITDCGKSLQILDFEHSIVIDKVDISEDEVYDCVWTIPVKGRNLHIYFEEFDIGNTSSDTLNDLFSNPVYDEWGKDSFMTLTAYRSDNRGGFFIRKFDTESTKSNTSVFLDLPPDSLALYLRTRSVKHNGKGFRLTMNLFHTGNASITRHETVFKCGNSLYVDSSAVCDGHNQCGDNSDEDADLCASPRTGFNNCTRSPSGCLMRKPTDVLVVDSTPCCADNPLTEPCMYLRPNDTSEFEECCPKEGTGVVCAVPPPLPNFWADNMYWFILGGIILLLLIFIILILLLALRRRRRRRPYTRVAETAPEGEGPAPTATPPTPPTSAPLTTDPGNNEPADSGETTPQRPHSSSPSSSSSSSSTTEPQLGPVEIEAPALRAMVEAVVNQEDS
ncbi:uncharacterized protein LOC106159849 [Lingula anatina]|uniref:Uncharacterized protein LOC106159849 n=1 Tax=Lingula anatina TaxID=7574 RepID=A0A1S3I0E3_LINAN|nr:uncharacterized protein LOC106159849 [Lingula anatina]|eukprot:XP_013391732.1 uncharacterized protein LOC106159849 [Lingula anatina]